MAKHNKKRNIGIVYELLLRHISNALVENNMKQVKLATAILEKHFNNNAVLYKEFRLVNALANSKVSSTESAVTILSEAKAAARRLDEAALDKAKSKLIRDINYNLKDKSFYYRNIPNYVDLANVQNLVNEWKKGDDSNLKKLVELESTAVSLLMQEKKTTDVYDQKNKLDMSKSNKLVLKLMTEKINKKYGSLSADQKEIIKNYAFYNTPETKNKLLEFLQSKKNECLIALEEFRKINENQFVGAKIEDVRKKVLELNCNDMSDESMLRFMTVTNLVDQIRGK